MSGLGATFKIVGLAGTALGCVGCEEKKLVQVLY